MSKLPPDDGVEQGASAVPTDNCLAEDAGSQPLPASYSVVQEVGGFSSLWLKKAGG